jgi:adenine-specific DNA-methyltransferase
VQNTKQGERLTFDTLEPFTGKWIQGEGSFTTRRGDTKRVAVSIGPEHGTVGPTHVMEAVRGVGFDILVVCGFAFDARVGESARRLATWWCCRLG